jgi:hypothetical protein
MQGFGELEHRDDLPARTIAIADERLEVGLELRELTGFEPRDVVHNKGPRVAYGGHRSHPREGEHAKKAGASEQGYGRVGGVAAALIGCLVRRSAEAPRKHSRVHPSSRGTRLGVEPLLQ